MLAENNIQTVGMFIPRRLIIANKDQPRKYFDDETIKELAESVKDKGVIEPLIVGPADANGNYPLIAGERRLRAATMADIEEVPAVIRVSNDDDEVALIENVHREDLNPVDLGLAFKSQLRKYKNVAAMARALHVTRKTIDDAMLFVKADVEVQEMVARREFPRTPNVMYALLNIKDKEQRIGAAKAISSQRLTVDQSLKLLKKLGSGQKTKVGSNKKSSSIPAFYVADVSDIELKAWSAVRQAGLVPPWLLFVKSADHTCHDCGFGHAPNAVSICESCPMSKHIKRLMESVKEHGGNNHANVSSVDDNGN